MKRRRFMESAAGATALLASRSLAAPTKADRPNILWLTCEDNNVNWVGCYGNPHADTPNIDQLAREGFRYTHCYANAPVCAPSRSTWITGMLSLSNGTFPMRSRYDIPHDRIKYYPDYLRDAGYYTGNFKKTDYNIGGRPDGACWDNPKKVDWDALKRNQPFFQVINATESHESRAQGDVENTLHDPANTKLRAYHPDVPGMRENYAKYHDAMKRMDGQVGESLRALKKMGLADNTIVIHNSDHGGVLPRSKRYLFESGLHCPLIIRMPERFKSLWPAKAPGSTVDRLVSFVDMPKTWLSLAGVEPSKQFQGKIFLGPRAEPERTHHFAFRGRMDERIESARAVSDKRHLYIRNYMPYVPWVQHLEYLWKMKATQVWEEHVESGKASEVQARFFKPKEWTEELYDMERDPDSVNNLIENPEMADVAKRMRATLREQQLQLIDSGMLPESEVVKLAKENGITIYDLARDPKLYNLPRLLDTADLALEENPARAPKLKALLSDSDAGVRYWATVGCFLLNDDAARAVIDDESHETRAMAAWTLIKRGEKEEGYACLERLLNENSYATLTVLNMIDWIGPEARERMLPIVKALTPEKKSYEERMRNNLLTRASAT